MDLELVEGFDDSLEVICGYEETEIESPDKNFRRFYLYESPTILILKY